MRAVVIIVGISALITAILLFSRSPTGAIIAIMGAMVSASFTIFLIFVVPLWAIVVLALDLGIIWIITANMDEFGTDIP